MEYTIKISDTNTKAQSIINMLKALAQDYDFLTITEDPMALTQEQDAELDRRYRFVKANPEKGKTWDEFVKSL